jgi:3-methyl-2-oxobutanoate hydroxymethyltransferase
MRSAGRVLKETGAQAVKLEGLSGNGRNCCLPGSSRHSCGRAYWSYTAVYSSARLTAAREVTRSGERILQEAIALEQAGAFALVLEHIPDELGSQITQKLTIPTIGIGAGPHCDGQVLVTSDLLGLSERQPRSPKLMQIYERRLRKQCRILALRCGNGSSHKVDNIYL